MTRIKFLIGPSAVAAVLLAFVPGASALSSHTYSTSFAGSGPSSLTNPTDVVVEQSTGDLWVANPPANEQQTLSVEATEGSFTLSFDGQTTAAIRVGASLEKIQQALEALSTIGNENVALYEPGEGESAILIEFTNDLAEKDVPQLTVNTSALKGGAATAQTGTVQTGSPVSEVVKLTAAGAFLAMIGKGVNQTASEVPGSSEAEQNLCSAASGDSCRPGTAGTTPGAFDGEFIDLIPHGPGVRGQAEHRLFVAIDESPGGESDLYVADPGDEIVQKFDLEGMPITDWGEGGLLTGKSVGEGKDAGARFSDVNGIAVGPAGDLVVDGQRGAFSGLFYFSQSDGAFVTKQFAPGPLVPSPRGIASDSGGSIYLAGANITKSVPEVESASNTYLDTAPLAEIGEVTQGDALGLRVDPATRDLYAMTRSKSAVEHFGPACLPRRRGSLEVEPCAPAETFGGGQLSNPAGVSVDDASGDAYVADTDHRRIAVYTPSPFLPDASASVEGQTETTVELSGDVDPAGAGPITECRFEYVATPAWESTRYGRLATGGAVPCQQTLPINSAESVSAKLTGLTFGSNYHFRLFVENANGLNTSFDHSVETLPEAPQLGAETVSGVSADVAEVHALITPGGGDLSYHTNYVVEYGETSSYGSQTSAADVGSARTPQLASVELSKLNPNTTYHYRVVATNVSGSATGPDHTFTTFPFNPDYQDACANSHVRQQTSAAGLLDCRAYELVSAADTAGYDVESNLVTGQTPFGSYPQAVGRVLYGVQDGGIPGTGSPTNRGIDPYVATRGESGWTTKYVGIPADNPFASGPFSSTILEADANLETIAFGGPEICSPCFEDGSTGIPVHLPGGELVQGMAGAESKPAAKPAGYVAKHLSADGDHLIFGSASKLQADGNEGEISIYDRDLGAQPPTTAVISKTPAGGNLPCAVNCTTDGIGELDVSSDGSHILLGQLISQTGGARYWRLYMNIGDSDKTTDVTPGTTTGVLFAGMTADGSKVFFTTKDQLLPGEDEDQSADLYEAEVSSSGVTLHLLSTGSEGSGNSDECDPVANSVHEHWNALNSSEETCGVVAIGGGEGVASASGTVYFLSPEKLQGSSNGTQDAPNLYIVRPGEAPSYAATLESRLSGPQPPKLSHTFDSEFGSFTNASGMAVDHASGDVYVFDSEAGVVEKFDSSGNPVDFTAGPEPGTNRLNASETGTGSFAATANFSSELAVDPSTGDLYVPDVFNSVVHKFGPAGNWITDIPVFLPTSVAVNSSNGNIYVAQLVDEATFTPHVGVFTSTGTPVPSASFEVTNVTPDAVAVDPSSGRVYVDQGGEEEAEVVVYKPNGEPIGTVDGNPAHSLALDPSDGTLYADEGSQVVQYEPSGERVGAVGAGHLSSSLGVAVDPEGNLYASNGTSAAIFTAHLRSSPLIDSPVVVDSVGEPEAHHTGDFQTNASGDAAVFPSTIPLSTGADPEGHTEIYRYKAQGESLACASCAVTGAASTSDASLASDGLSLTDDGRVFFTSADQLAVSDTDKRNDAYEWEEGGTGNCQSSSPSFGKAVNACIALISAGTGAFDSGLLGVSADATDAYFFTRDSLAPQDHNGPTMKIYDARVNGGIPFVFPPVACRASDECHGASSPSPGPLPIGSGTVTPPRKPGLSCKKGFVKRHGRCVRRHHKRSKHHKRHGGRKR